MRMPSIPNLSGALAFGLAFRLLAPAGFAAAAPVARVTATIGDNASGDEELALRGGLEDGAALETSEEGACSLLVDDDTLMEVCGNTLLSLERKDGDPDGARVVKLDRGEIRMVVEPRLGEEKVEIHTPAAIATVLGTILHASVNALSVSEIASEANRVQIQSTNPAFPETKVLEPGQSITIAADGSLGEIVELDPKEIKARGGCYVGLHDVPLSVDRGKAGSTKIAEMVETDVAEATLPPVATDPGGLPPFNPPETPGETPNPPLPPEIVSPPEMELSCPVGLPGETCF